MFAYVGNIQNLKDLKLGGHGPLASSPLLAVSPSPSCPLLFQPQHLMVASSCGGQNLALAVLQVPYSLASGRGGRAGGDRGNEATEGH